MPNRPRILLTHTPNMRTTYFGTKALLELNGLGTVVLHEAATPMTADAVILAAKGCQIVIADRNTPLPAAVFPGLTTVIAALRVAVDIRNIDVAAASAAGILVCQASRTWVASVAEMAVGLMIDTARGISRSNIAYKTGREPEICTGRQLRGSTIGIIGYGPLGRYLADLALALGMTVLVADPYATADRAGVTQVSLDDLLAAADFVLPAAVATDETENLINAAALARMKPTAFLINLSRGNLVDEAALEAALDAKRIAGAALDVGRAADQKPSLHIARRNDVSATPHIAGLTQGATEGQALEVVSQTAEILSGRMPIGAVNAAAARRMRKSG